MLAGQSLVILVCKQRGTECVLGVLQAKGHTCTVGPAPPPCWPDLAQMLRPHWRQWPAACLWSWQSWPGSWLRGHGTWPPSWTPPGHQCRLCSSRLVSEPLQQSCTEAWRQVSGCVKEALVLSQVNGEAPAEEEPMLACCTRCVPAPQHPRGPARSRAARSPPPSALQLQLQPPSPAGTVNISPCGSTSNLLRYFSICRYLHLKAETTPGWMTFRPTARNQKCMPRR